MLWNLQRLLRKTRRQDGNGERRGKHAYPRDPRKRYCVWLLTGGLGVMVAGGLSFGVSWAFQRAHH